MENDINALRLGYADYQTISFALSISETAPSELLSSLNNRLQDASIMINSEVAKGKREEVNIFEASQIPLYADEISVSMDALRNLARQRKLALRFRHGSPYHEYPERAKNLIQALENGQVEGYSQLEFGSPSKRAAIVERVRQRLTIMELYKDSATHEADCIPIWKIVEQRPETNHDTKELFGESLGIPELVFDCTYDVPGKGRDGTFIPAMDESLGFDAEDLLIIHGWASENEPKVIMLD